MNIAWRSAHAVGVELVVCGAVVYATGGVFYPTLFVPVVTAATTFALAGTLAVAFTAAALALIPSNPAPVAMIRALGLPAVALITHWLAAANRVEARQLQAAVARLAEAQAEIRRADRFAALGQLTAGLAHELRNPLGTIKNSAEMLQRQVEAASPVARELAEYIAQEVDRTSALVTRFLEFARPHHLRLEPADLHETLDRAITRFGVEHAGNAVSIFKNYSPDIPPVRLDAEWMQHVVSNLLANAAQASPAAGVITVKTQLAKTASVSAAEISVIDRGSGIAAEHLEHIFNPFFTTKPGGVGLGLPIVSKIVDEHGGTIHVETAPGEGSVFLVYLPL